MLELDKWNYFNENYSASKSYSQNVLDADELIKKHTDYIDDVGIARSINNEELSFLYALSMNLSKNDMSNEVNFESKIPYKDRYNLLKLNNGEWVITKYDNDKKIRFLGIYQSCKEACINLLSKLYSYDNDFYYYFKTAKTKDLMEIASKLRSFYDESFVIDINYYIRKLLDIDFDYNADSEERIKYRNAYPLGDNFGKILFEIKLLTLKYADSGYICDYDNYPGSYGEWINYISKISLKPYKDDVIHILDIINSQLENNNKPKKHK